jgi:hypothetical protein
MVWYGILGIGRIVRFGVPTTAWGRENHIVSLVTTHRIVVRVAEGKVRWSAQVFNSHYEYWWYGMMTIDN